MCLASHISTQVNTKILWWVWWLSFLACVISSIYMYSYLGDVQLMVVALAKCSLLASRCQAICNDILRVSEQILLTCFCVILYSFSRHITVLTSWSCACFKGGSASDRSRVIFEATTAGSESGSYAPTKMKGLSVEWRGDGQGSACRKS